METTEEKVVQLPLISPLAEESSVASYRILFLTRAYNRGEISFEGWWRLTEEWAERMIKQYGEGP